MAFNGVFIYAGTNEVPLDNGFIRAETYDATTNQRLELSAKRVATGHLDRKTAAFTPSKIEFETPIMWTAQLNQLMAWLHNNTTNALQRTIRLKFYVPEYDTYQTGVFYVPDIKFPIDHYEGTQIQYKQIRLAFIEV